MNIAFVNNKGGVGKTTSVFNVGSILARKGYRVLLVDMDSQCNLTIGTGAEKIDQNIYTAMKGQTGLVATSLADNLQIIQSVLEMKEIDAELSGKVGREFILKRLLSPVQDQFDFILFDCPPLLGAATANAICASHQVFIPVKSQYYDIVGLMAIVNWIKEIKEFVNPELEIGGIFLTMHIQGNMLNQSIEENVQSSFGDLLMSNRIRQNTQIAEAPMFKKDIVNYKKGSLGAMDYMNLTNELLQRINIKQ